MACRVGITTNPGERKRYWQTKYPALQDWRILKSFKTKSEAQNCETEYAQCNGCVASPGGAGPEIGNWRVYRFDF